MSKKWYPNRIITLLPNFTLKRVLKLKVSRMLEVYRTLLVVQNGLKKMLFIALI